MGRHRRRGRGRLPGARRARATGTCRRSCRTACRARSRRSRPRAAARRVDSLRSGACSTCAASAPTPTASAAALDRRGDAALLDPVLALDEERRALQTRVDELRAGRNAVSAEVAEAKRSAKGDPDAAARADGLIAEMRELKGTLGADEQRLREVGERLDAALLQVPNLPHESAPLGNREEDAEVLRLVGEQPSFGFEPRDHLELAERLDRHGARRPHVGLALRRTCWATSRGSGSPSSGCALDAPDRAGLHPRAAAGDGARGDDVRHGLLPDRPAVGLQPRGRRPVPGRHLRGAAGGASTRGEILDEAELPLRYGGLSACFRREAGAAGRDTRGIFRTHQFEKVEMFSFCHPDRSWDEHEWMLVDRGGDRAGARPALPGRQHRGGRPRRVGGQEVRHRGVAAGAGPLPRADELLQLHRLPGPPPARRATAGGRRAARPCTRSTAPP